MSSLFIIDQVGHTAEHNRLALHGLDVTRYGAVPDGVTDCTAAIQSAINDAASKLLSPSNTRIPSVVFPPGSYSITGNIEWKSCDLIGLGSPRIGTRIEWNGTAGGTAITRTFAPGGTSFGLLANIGFTPGSAEPGVWVDFTAGAVDVLLQLERCHFIGGTDTAIKLAGWFNAHWRNLRFDNNNWCISATPGSGQYLSSFVLDQFTVDHHRLSAPGQGVFRIDNTANNSNLGTVTLRGGRIELNTEWTGAKAIFSVKVPNTTPNSRTVGMRLDDVTFQDVTTTSTPVIINRDTTATTGGESLVLTNFRQSGLAGLKSGGWDAGLEIPTLTGNTGVLSFHQAAP